MFAASSVATCLHVGVNVGVNVNICVIHAKLVRFNLSGSDNLALATTAAQATWRRPTAANDDYTRES